MVLAGGLRILMSLAACSLVEMSNVLESVCLSAIVASWSQLQQQCVRDSVFLVSYRSVNHHDLEKIISNLKSLVRTTQTLACYTRPRCTCVFNSEANGATKKPSSNLLIPAQHSAHTDATDSRSKDSNFEAAA